MNITDLANTIIYPKKQEAMAAYGMSKTSANSNASTKADKQASDKIIEDVIDFSDMMSSIITGLEKLDSNATTAARAEKYLARVDAAVQQLASQF